MKKMVLSALVLAGALYASDVYDAAKSGNMMKLKELIAKGNNVDEKGDVGRTALHYAVSENNIDMVTLLIMSDANVNALDKYGRTPLHYAYYYSSTADFEPMIKLLLKSGADTSIKDVNGKTPAQMVKKKK